MVSAAALPCLGHTSGLIRRLAATALGKAADIGDQIIVEALVPLLTDPDESACEAAVAAISHIGDGTTVQLMLSHLRPGPNHGTSTLQASSLQLLGKLASQGDERVLEIVRAKLKDQVPEIRAAAFNAVALLAPTNITWMTTVCEFLTVEKHPQVKAAALGALVHTCSTAERGNAFAVNLVSLIVRGQGNGLDVRVAAVDALAHIANRNDEQAVDAIIASMKTPESSLRQAAELVLVKIVDRGDKRAVEAMLGQVSSQTRDCYVQVGALSALAQVAAIGDRRAIDAAHGALRTGVPPVRQAALRAMVTLTEGKDRTRTIAAACSQADGGPSKDRWLIEQALETLAQLCSEKRKRGAPVIAAVACLSNRNSPVRIAACDCLRVIAPKGMSSVNQELGKLLEDDSSAVRLAAVRALGHLGTLQDAGLVQQALERCCLEADPGQGEVEQQLRDTATLALEQLQHNSGGDQSCCSCF